MRKSCWGGVGVYQKDLKCDPAGCGAALSPKPSFHMGLGEEGCYDIWIYSVHRSVLEFGCEHKSNCILEHGSLFEKVSVGAHVPLVHKYDTNFHSWLLLNAKLVQVGRGDLITTWVVNSASPCGFLQSISTCAPCDREGHPYIPQNSRSSTSCLWDPFPHFVDSNYLNPAFLDLGGPPSHLVSRPMFARDSGLHQHLV